MWLGFGPVSSLPVSTAPYITVSVGGDDSGGGAFPYHPRRRGRRQVALEISLGDAVSWTLAPSLDLVPCTTACGIELAFGPVSLTLGSHSRLSPTEVSIPWDVELDSIAATWSMATAVTYAPEPEPEPDPYAAQIEEEDELFLLGMLP